MLSIHLSICLRLLRICSAVCLVVMCSCLLLLNYWRCLCFSCSAPPVLTAKLVNRVLGGEGRGPTPRNPSPSPSCCLKRISAANITRTAGWLAGWLAHPSSFAAARKTQSDNCPESPQGEHNTRIPTSGDVTITAKANLIDVVDGVVCGCVGNFMFPATATATVDMSWEYISKMNLLHEKVFVRQFTFEIESILIPYICSLNCFVI